MGLAELIERLEKAAEGSRILDAAIDTFVVCGEQGPFGAYKTAQERSEAAVRERWNFPAYTISLDAALTLVPEWSDGIWWRVQVTPAQTTAAVGGPVFSGREGVIGATPALALCIAALKARASSAGPKRD